MIDIIKNIKIKRLINKSKIKYVYNKDILNKEFEWDLKDIILINNLLNIKKENLVSYYTSFNSELFDIFKHICHGHDEVITHKYNIKFYKIYIYKKYKIALVYGMTNTIDYVFFDITNINNWKL